MNKWYQPFGLLLVAAMMSDLTGCAQTQGWARKSSKKAGEEKVASAEKNRSGSSKSAKSAKSGKSLADAKGTAKSSMTDAKVSKATKANAQDAEGDKLASAERPKTSRSALEPASAKADSSKQDKVDVAKRDMTVPVNKSLAANKGVAASDKSKPKTDEDLDAFLVQAEKPVQPPKRSDVKSISPSAADLTDEDSAFSNENVVQVKKEVSKDEEDDIADWADVKTNAATVTAAKAPKTPKVAPMGSDEWESPNETSSSSIKRTSASWDDETPAASNASANDESRPAKQQPAHKSDRSTTSHNSMTDMCPQAGPELQEVLSGMSADDPESLKQGLHRIGQMRKDGKAAAPLLTTMLKHDDAFVRVHAALAMARLNLSNDESVAVITESLKSRNAGVRSFSVAVVAEMGPRSSEVLSKLSESLNDRDGQVRLRSAEVLIRHEDFAYPALQCLLSCLKDKDENVRWLTTYSLAELAPESPEAVQALLKAAKDPASKVRVGAVYAIGEIGPFAKRSSDELRKMLETAEDDELKSAINHSLAQINKPAQESK